MFGVSGNKNKRGPMNRQGKRILVVDDSQEYRDLLGIILSMNGYEFDSAQDGIEALEKLQASAFDLIISDVLMNRMDGFQLCREVKMDPKLKAIPVIFYTGHYTDAKDEEMLQSLGAALYLVKPIARDQLLKSIHQVLERSSEENIATPVQFHDEEAFAAAHADRVTIKLYQKIEEIERERTNLQVIFDTAQVGMLLIGENGAVTRINEVVTQLIGKDAADFLGRQPGDGLSCINAAGVAAGCGHAKACPSCPIRNTLLTVLRTGEVMRGVEADTRLIINGQERQFSFSISASPIVLNGGNHVLLTILDITDRKRTEAYRELGREVLQILYEPGDIQDYIRRILAVLKTRTGFDAVGIRLQDEDDFPYFAQKGFPKDFLLTENTLIARAADGGVCLDKDGNVSLECTCGLVISGKTDPANSLCTSGGSYWNSNRVSVLVVWCEPQPGRTS